MFVHLENLSEVLVELSTQLESEIESSYKKLTNASGCLVRFGNESGITNTSWLIIVIQLTP